MRQLIFTCVIGHRSFVVIRLRQHCWWKIWVLPSHNKPQYWLICLTIKVPSHNSHFPTSPYTSSKKVLSMACCSWTGFQQGWAHSRAWYSDTLDHIPLPFIKNTCSQLQDHLKISSISLHARRNDIQVENLARYTIPTKPPYSSPKNFRPISIASILARTFKEMLKRKIGTYREKHPTISCFQHRFQKRLSTNTVMLRNLMSG